MYKCNSCQHEGFWWEFSDDENPTCPKCYSEDLSCYHPYSDFNKFGVCTVCGMNMDQFLNKKTDSILPSWVALISIGLIVIYLLIVLGEILYYV